MNIQYTNKNVLEAAKDRIKYVFDEFDNIYVSISSGKDSTVLYHLVLHEAILRNRRINVFFLDQEAEYKSTINLMRKLMSHPNVTPYWYQVPIYMTNSSSFEEDMLYAFDPNKRDLWIHEKEEISIKEIKEEYPKRFYKFFDWFEKTRPDNTAFFVGLRSKESLNRFRAVMKKVGYKDITWSIPSKNKNSYRFYPIYDWMFGDIWKFINDNNLPYNKMYELMYLKSGGNISNMRVSNLIHEKSFRCLKDLQEFEPDTYNKLVKRLKGTHCAALYFEEDIVYKANVLPKVFKYWSEYKEYLLNIIPTKQKNKFIKRFEKQGNDEMIYQQQCKQLLINDWENNMPIDTKKHLLKEKYWDLL
jgi:predicted phosphoadenosine phosphosulfate sulfurtransferase